MSVSASMAGVAAANAAVAANAARKAKIAACEATMPAYEHETATTEQAQSYAECVRLFHPTEITGGEAVFIKVLIVCVFAGCGIGAWLGHKDYGTGWFLGLVGGLIGGFSLPLSLAGAFMAIRFLFS